MKYLFLLLVLFVAADFEVEIVLEQPNTNETYTNAFKITNVEYLTGNDATIVNLSYNVSNEEYFFSGNVTKSVKKFSKSKTSNISFFSNETMEVCVSIYVYNDTNLLNNYVCKTFFEPTVAIEEIVSEECELTLDSPEVFEKTAKLHFDVTAEEYELEYWVEDSNGNVVKEKRTTNNDNTKSFTPKEIGLYYLHAELDCGTVASAFFFVNKPLENSLEMISMKTNPVKFEFRINSDSFVEKGLSVFVDDKLLLNTDVKKSSQLYFLELGEYCGSHDLLIKTDEFEESVALSLEECVKEKVFPKAEVIATVTESFVLVSLMLPERVNYEVYLRKSGRVISEVIKEENEGLVIIKLIPLEEGSIEAVAVINGKKKVNKLSFQNVKLEMVIKNSVPLPTAAAISQNSSNNSISWIFSSIVLLVFVADKYLKHKRSSSSNERKRD